MADRVQRWASIAVGLGMVGLVGWVTYAETEHQGRGHARADADGGKPSASSGTTDDAAAPLAATSGAPVTTGGPTLADLDGGFGLGFLDASLAMPQTAPRTVHIGVVLVQFQGAEGAGNNARTKKDALAQAEKLHDDAKADWKHAVREGDSGSSEDIGRIPRGVLDPRTEIAVFSLGAGELSDVLETPKGFWVVKRLE